MSGFQHIKPKGPLDYECPKCGARAKEQCHVGDSSVKRKHPCLAREKVFVKDKRG